MAGSIELAFLLLLTGAAPPPKEGYCVTCHRSEAEPRLSLPTSSVAASVHASLESPCVACHGGSPRDPTPRAHDIDSGFRGRPTPGEVPRLCGACHSDAAYIRRYSANLSTDQLALFRVSHHGLALAEGSTRAATCISCHGAHGVRRVNDPASPVSPRNVAATCGTCHSDRRNPALSKTKLDPVAHWKKSVHARALMEKQDTSAPTCNDCHGDHGAAPPGMGDVHRACGQCHAEQSERFQASAHREPFQRLGFGECQECHGNHEIEAASDAMLTRGEGGACKRCHTVEDKGGRAATQMLEKLGEASDLAKMGRQDVEALRRTGLLIPDAEACEKELYTALQRLRIAVHGLDPTSLDPELSEVRRLVDQMRQASTKARDELRFRRNGYVFFILVIALMIGLLVAKLRRLSRS